MLLTITRRRRPTQYVLRCDCCGCLSRPAATAFLATRWGHLCKWDTPAEEYADCGYDRCPRCVDMERWPVESDGWQPIAPVHKDTGLPWLFRADDLHGGPAIRRGDNADAFDAWRAEQAAKEMVRLADGDDAVTLPLDKMPEALVVSEGR